VTLRNIGRNGQTLQLTVKGSDASEVTTEAYVQLASASGTPVIAFDTNWDGVADSADQLLHFDTSTLGEATFTGTITLPGLFATDGSIASASVSLSNIYGTRSEAATASIATQTVAQSGEACDASEVASRCVEGLACAGQPAACQMAAAPSLTQVAYYEGVTPTEVFAGSAPAEDLASIQVAFEDAAGNAVSVDLGSGTAVSTFTLDARGAEGQSFSFVNSPAPTFAQAVAKITATAYDALGNSGPAAVATLSMQPLSANGQSCDANGLIGCYQGSACSPGLTGSKNLCGGIPSLQSAKCAEAAPPATEGILAAWGVNQGVSLWDPPAGCVFASEMNRPETVIALKLTKAVGTLTLSTVQPETNFDTVLYVLPSCATSSSTALGCNDDSVGFASTLTLENVAAGTYYVVVDSATADGGQFGLSIAAQ
jgi:hypothetical protein